MEERARKLISDGDELFTKRQSLMTLWQEVADNFYVERADFTYQRSLGKDFAEHLMTSYPVLARRDLGNSFSAMLRPTAKEWFKLATNRDDQVDEQGRRWLEYAGGVMRRAMYARPAMFVRATKEGDHDFATFGQCVLSVELNRRKDDLLYRCWHLRDCAWAESVEGKVNTLHRKWKPTARQACELFPKVDPKLQTMAEKAPYAEVELRHIVVPADTYDGPGKRAPYVSIFLDVLHGFIMEERPLRWLGYVVPRWQTVSGSQYAYSPATVAALPDARLLQAMTLTLLEAGEKAASPPMVATKEAIRSDVALFAGGITWVDAEYDEKLGEALRPLTQDQRGLPVGLEMTKSIRELLQEAFFLNKLGLPQVGENPEMTAFEAGQRVQEYIRQALPLFEPMELEYNGALCDATFDVMFRAGAFGSPLDIPPSLRGVDIEFRFESPLNEAIEAQKGAKLVQAKQLLAQVVDLDPTSAAILDAKGALRDALRGIGLPATWLRDEQEVANIDQQAQDAQKAQQLLGTMGQAADVTQKLGMAGQAINGAMGPGAASDLANAA